MFTESVWDGIDGVVFDAVGTLIEPEPSVADVYLGAAARQGVVLGRSEVKARFGLYFRNDEVDEQRGLLVTDEGLEFRRWRRIVGSVLAEAPDQEKAFRELWDHFARPGSWRCFADVGPTLQVLEERGMPLRIASNFDGRLRGVVEGLDELRGLRGSLVISSEVGYRKPHASFYRAACDSLGLEAARVLYVGDDLENDVAGPYRAGLKAVLVDRLGGEGNGVPTVANLNELVASRQEGIVRDPF